jgi:ankyrin repeat protein
VNERDETALHWGVHIGVETIVKLLLDIEANVHAHDCGGDSALHWVCFRNKMNIARILILHGADIMSMNRNFKTPLDYVRNQIEKLELYEFAC